MQRPISAFSALALSPGLFAVTLALALLAPGGCKKKTPKVVKPSKEEPQEKPAQENKPEPASSKIRAQRVVAIGDVHGDLAATKSVLKLAGLIDDQERWTGGSTVLVQTGDILDRGDDEPEILALFWRLQDQAKAQGGRVELLLGNHEVMNAQGDLRYVTPGGFEDYAKTKIPEQWPRIDEKSQGLPLGYLARKAAFVPGSDIARRFAQQKVVTMVGDTVFVHGGLSPEHAELGIEAMNEQTQAWLAGTRKMPELLKDSRGPVWNRQYGQRTGARACASLERALKSLGAGRMVIGHTVQSNGITSACQNKVWRIDVGMARHYGGPSQALEIIGDQVKVLSQTQ